MHTKVFLILRILTTITLAGTIICYLMKAKTYTHIFFILMTIFAFSGLFYSSKHKDDN